jgi:hypothetical protein
MLPDLMGLPVVSPPYELLEPRAGQQVALRVVKWELGRIQIVPRDGREARWVYCLRVTVKDGDKPTWPPYWDVTAGHAVAALWSQFGVRDLAKTLFKLSFSGTGPTKRPVLETVPM